MTNKLYKLIADMCGCENCKADKPCQRVDQVFEALKASPLTIGNCADERSIDA